MEPVVLVASDEFTLKSAPVRRTLEQRLIDDLKTGLMSVGINSISIRKHAARLVIRGTNEAERAARACARVFGVAYAAPAVAVHASMEDIVEAIDQLAGRVLGDGKSFAIRAHRSTPSPIDRRQVEVQAGTEVLRALATRKVRVDLRNPDITIHVDLADQWAYVYHEKFEGPAGLPPSSRWKLLAVLDSGPLTVLATYAVMRRGCLTELFMPISSTIPSFAEQSQLLWARRIRGLVSRTKYRVFIINLDSVLGDRSAIDDVKDVKPLARMAALRFAKQRKFRGIVFSDVFGRLADFANAADFAGGYPVPFYPLIGLNKEDLVDMNKRLGLAEDELLKYGLSSHSRRTEAALSLDVGLANIAPQELLL